MLSAILVLIGLLLAPIGLVAATAKQTLSDTDTFVAAFAPLASQPEFKALAVDIAVTAISNNIDTASVSAWTEEQVESLGLSSRVQAPIDLLLQLAPNRLRSLLTSTVANWVDSDQFRSAWELVLRGGHSQWVAILEQDPKALLVAHPDGAVMLQVWPIIPTLLTQQNERITDFIALVPAFTYEIPLRQGVFLDRATEGYSVVLVAGTWVPWISLRWSFWGLWPRCAA